MKDPLSQEETVLAEFLALAISSVAFPQDLRDGIPGVRNDNLQNGYTGWLDHQEQISCTIGAIDHHEL